jgi:hypothetical protein
MTGIKAGITATAIALVGIAAANGVAYAATGHAFVLGEKNQASTTTTLTRTTSGVPLALNAVSGSAPLAVNSTKRVAKLNADMVDGLHATSLEMHAIQYLLPQTTTDMATFPGLAPGVYLVNMNATVYTTSATDELVDCGIEAGPSHYVDVAATVTTHNHVAIATASGIVDARQGGVQLSCSDGVADLELLADSAGSYVSFTKVADLKVLGAAAG